MQISAPSLMLIGISSFSPALADTDPFRSEQGARHLVHTEHLELMPVFILILGKHRRILKKEKGFQYSYIIPKNHGLFRMCAVFSVF